MGWSGLHQSYTGQKVRQWLDKKTQTWHIGWSGLHQSYTGQKVRQYMIRQEEHKHDILIDLVYINPTLPRKKGKD